MARMTFHRFNRVRDGCLMAAALLVICGCIPSRTRTGGLFAEDPVSPPIIRVRLMWTDSLYTITPEGRFILRLYQDACGDVTVYSSHEPLTVQYVDDCITVSTGDSLLLASCISGLSVHEIDGGDRLTLHDRPYYGTLLFGWTTKREPLIVNRLNLDTYLTGVLTPELGERSPEEFEAVKAQSVASRTYALAHLGQFMPPVSIHPGHQRRVAEMKEPGLSQKIVAYVLYTKGVVGPWVVQKQAINAWRVNDQGIGTGLTGDNNHSLS